MRRLPLAISIVTVYLGLGALAFASDLALPAKAPPLPPPPVWSWSGYYVGGNVGYSWGNSDFNEYFYNSLLGTPIFATGTNLQINGVIGGGQIGGNWQFGNWVLGLEADIQASGEQGSGSLICGACSGTPLAPLAVTTSVTEKLNWFGTVRPRLGWTVTPTTMVYATGGLAYGQLNDSGSITNGAITSPFSYTNTSLGWVIGAGVEVRLIGNWTGKIEYLYMQLEEPSGNDPTGIPAFCATFPVAACPGQFINSQNDPPHFSDNILRAGINYKWP